MRNIKVTYVRIHKPLLGYAQQVGNAVYNGHLRQIQQIYEIVSYMDMIRHNLKIYSRHPVHEDLVGYRCNAGNTN